MPTSARPSLPELQRWMRWVLTFPSGVGAVINSPHRKASLPRHWTRGPEPKRWLPVIGQSPEVSQETRLAIYGDGYFLRIVGVLASNYASLRNVLGAHEFDDHMAHTYLVKHPSTHKCIDNVGDRMADFLKTYGATKELPFLPDLARLEWAFHESFFADESSLLDPSRLDGVPLAKWATARLWLDASVRLLDLRHPVVPLWRDDGKWTRRRCASLRRAASPVLVYRRPDGQVRVAEQEAGTFALLSALHAGKPFGAALKIAARRGLAPSRVMPLFREWTELGVICRVGLR